MILLSESANEVFNCGDTDAFALTTLDFAAVVLGAKEKLGEALYPDVSEIVNCDWMRVGNTIDVENNTDGLISVVGNKIDVENDFDDGNSNCSFACVVIIKMITPFVCTVSCMTGTMLCAGSCVTGAMLCVDSCVPGTVKNGVLYATRFVNEFLSDDIVAVAPFVVKLPRCNFSPLGSSIVSISASCF